MALNQKTLSILITFTVLGIVSFSLIREKERVVDQPDMVGKNNTQNEPLSPRAERIKAYLANPDIALKYSVGARRFGIVSYLASDPSNPNRSDYPQARGGILVFEGNNVVWESKEFITNLFNPNLDDNNLRDINNDGIKEIFYSDAGGGNRFSCAFYMYQWRDGTFHLISPYGEVTTSKGTYRGTIVEDCGPSIRDGFLKDIDGDGTDELIQATYDNKKLTYKFNGTEYKLWKEEPASPYNSKDWEPTNE